MTYPMELGTIYEINSSQISLCIVPVIWSCERQK